MVNVSMTCLLFGFQSGQSHAWQPSRLSQMSCALAGPSALAVALAAAVALPLVFVSQPVSAQATPVLPSAGVVVGAAVSSAVTPTPTPAPTSTSTSTSTPAPTSTSTSALSFAQAYQAARSFDAGYRAAGHVRDATYFNVPIARAALLPTLSLTAAESSVKGTREFANGLNQQVRTRLNYEAPQASLQLRVPLLNYEAYNVYKQSQVQTVAADEIFRAEGMDLIDRLATNYLQVMLAGEGLTLIKTQVAALEVQLQQSIQREQRGEATRVQVVQFQAALDLSKARVLEAEDQLQLARRQLERLTGVPNAQFPSLPAQVNSLMPMPDKLGDWLELARGQSPSLRSREIALELSKLAVKRQFAGHLPRIELVASLARSRNDTSSNVGQSTNLRSLGVQLTVPLYSGGGVDASVQQASSRQAQAEEEVRQERELLEVEIQRYYQAVINGDLKIAAYQRAVASAALALQGARRSQELGMGTASDVADSQSRHFVALRDLAQARVEQMLSRVRLLVRAGTPMGEVVADLDASLLARNTQVATAKP